MINWRDIRDYKALTTFLDEFQSLTKIKQEEVLIGMVMSIEIYKQNESQTDLFKDQGIKGVDKSTKTSPREKRHRRPNYGATSRSR